MNTSNQTNVQPINYLNWKGWSDKNFGVLSASESRYFSAEIKRSGIQLDDRCRVLEIGFGNGSFIAYALERNWNITGIEANSELVKLAKNIIPAYLVTDMHQLDYGSYDLVVAFDVLEHLNETKLIQTFETVKRLLKDDGVFIARFPNGDSPFGLANQNGDFTHISSIGLGKVKYLLSLVDFKLIYFGGEAEVILGKNPFGVLNRTCRAVIKKFINSFVNYLVKSKRNGFCSSNLVVILRS
jgi:2-polyprenyl-3-methyl-5-hydroxy-6-metoxy-1,4-benzoquinol methylase